MAKNYSFEIAELNKKAIVEFDCFIDVIKRDPLNYKWSQEYDAWRQNPWDHEARKSLVDAVRARGWLPSEHAANRVNGLWNRVAWSKKAIRRGDFKTADYWLDFDK